MRMGIKYLSRLDSDPKMWMKECEMTKNGQQMKIEESNNKNVMDRGFQIRCAQIWTWIQI